MEVLAQAIYDWPLIVIAAGVVYLFLVFSLMVGCSQTDILRQSGVSPFPVCLIYAL